MKTRSWAKVCGVLLLAIVAWRAAAIMWRAKLRACPENVRTLAVPTFQNRTQTYRIEARLTAAVVREFDTEPNTGLSAIPPMPRATLRGTVLSTQIEPLTYDPRTGRASAGVITIRMSVTLTGSNGEVFFRNSNYLFRDEYQSSQQVFSFFEEQDPAFDRLCNDFARTLVSNVLEAF